MSGPFEGEELIKLALVCALVHVLESMRPGGRGLDLIVAQQNLDHPDVRAYLDGLNPVLLPLPRDGKKPLTFPELEA